MKPKEFVGTLCELEFTDTFNPYANQCPIHDLPRAASLRREALLAILEEAVQNEIDSLWIGRDLGYRGGRRTGIALTDDLHIDEYASRWGIAIERPTKGPPVAERTAATIWSVLRLIERPIVLWNVFPLHPHENGEPFSNRAHNSRERQVGEWLLAVLVKMLQPAKLVAIGNDAARVVSRIEGPQKVYTIRHPSYGGQTEFLQQIRSLYSLSDHNRLGRLPW